ncbi:MAG: hypothetical protein ACREDR_42915, partial [Blastocatellia bacterium]
LLAHANPAGLVAEGEIEPVVGREWRSENKHNQSAGQHVEFMGIAFQPGSYISEAMRFEIGNFGIWTAQAGNPWLAAGSSLS